MAIAASIPRCLLACRLRRWLAVLAALALAGCHSAAAPEAAPYMCLLPSEQRMLVAELFFGRAIAGRGDLTEAEWTNFAADTITPNFPDGFTAFDGDGQWRGPRGTIVRERTKIVLVAAKRAPDLTGRIQAVIDAYKARFRQQSVGIVTRDSCAAF
jgi:uncharacterized protein DUF3574